MRAKSQWLFLAPRAPKPLLFCPIYWKYTKDKKQAPAFISHSFKTEQRKRVRFCLLCTILKKIHAKNFILLGKSHKKMLLLQFFSKISAVYSLKAKIRSLAAALRANDVVSCGHKWKIRKQRSFRIFVMSVRFRCKAVCGWFRCTMILQRVD